jgi:hypothetical protein
VAGASTPWQSGATQESTITDCGSIILGSPMASPGAAVTPYVNEDYNSPLVVGQVYYLAVTVFGIGNSCSQMAADIQFALPSGTTPEISAATPVVCLPLEPNASNTQIVNGPPDTSAGCPQVGTPTGNNTYRFDMAANTGVFATRFYPFWPVPQGFGVEGCSRDAPITGTR